MGDIKNIKAIGKAIFNDFNAFANWYQEDGKKWAMKQWQNGIYALQDTYSGIWRAFDRMYPNSFDTWKKDRISDFSKINDYAIAFNQKFDLYLTNEEWSVIGFSDKHYIVPTEFLEILNFKNYDHLTTAELRQLNVETSAIVPASDAISVNTINSKVEENKSALEDLKKSMEDVKNARTDELAALQAEIDKKMAELEAEKERRLQILLKKQEEMEKVKENLEKQLFLLSTEIYGIRCFMGETIDFLQLCSGKNANIDEPIVFYSKVRYLDNELGKMASIYDVDWSSHELFEHFLQNRKDCIETFCPNPKSICIIQVSQTGVVYGTGVIQNVLEAYKVYHGSRIGILIRNGDNLYIGWTDDEMINLQKSSNVFYSPGIIKDESVQSDSKEQFASRYFIYSLLQGVLENTKMLEIPEKDTFFRTQSSKYIVFSSADGWITDNRFGDFSDILDKANVQHRVGDKLLMVKGLSDGNRYSQNYHCQRQHGELERTRDCHVENGNIYKLNLIEETEYGPEYYISVKKEWSRCGATSNFAIEKDEFINLTFMNSVWLKYTIINQKIGLFVDNNMLSYAQLVKYLKIALDFVVKREESEFTLISEYFTGLSEVSDWQIILSEWKLEKNIHEITEYQAKRFAKYLTEYLK